MSKLFKEIEDSTWKDVKGYEGLYKVSKFGEVQRVGGSVLTKSGHFQRYSSKILKPYQGQVYLSKDGKVSTFRVRDLVAQAFIPGYEEGQPVFYISGLSDCLDNLTLHLDSVEAEDAIWKFIPGFEGIYQASIHGEIRSVRRVIKGNKSERIAEGKILSQTLGDDGYLECILSADGSSRVCSVHRLVALTFLDNPENKPQVNHKDGNKQNNNLNNLEWATRSENMQHAKNLGLWNPKECGKASRQSIGKPVRCITDGNEFLSISSAANFYGMDDQSVSDSIRLKRERKGKQFELME